VQAIQPLQKERDMLPSVKTLKTSAIASVLALCLAIPAAPAFAWGQREQDVLKGVIGTLAVTALIKEVRKPRQQIVYGGPKSYSSNAYDSGYNTGYQQPRQTQSDIYSSAAAQAFNSYTYSERQQIQRDLKRRGYYSGSIDGAFGPQTFRATAAYARATGNVERLATRNGAYGIYDSLV